MSFGLGLKPELIKNTDGAVVIAMEGPEPKFFFRSNQIDAGNYADELAAKQQYNAVFVVPALLAFLPRGGQGYT